VSVQSDLADLCFDAFIHIYLFLFLFPFNICMCLWDGQANCFTTT